MILISDEDLKKGKCVPLFILGLIFCVNIIYNCIAQSWKKGKGSYRYSSLVFVYSNDSQIKCSVFKHNRLTIVLILHLKSIRCTNGYWKIL